MKMKLYTSKTSPFGRKVRVVAEELGLADLIEEIATDPMDPSPELLAANPLSKVPTLVTERNEALPDSCLIIEYLQTRGRGLASLPRGTRRWAALRRVEVADGLTAAAVAMVFEKRRPESIVHTPFLDRQTALIRRALEVLDAEAAQLALESPSVVEVTVACALGYLDFRLPYIEWRREHEPLALWFAQFSQRSSMVKTQPPI